MAGGPALPYRLMLPPPSMHVWIALLNPPMTLWLQTDVEGA